MITIKTEILKPIANILNSVAVERAYLIGNNGIHFHMQDGRLNISADSRELNVLFSNVKYESEFEAEIEFLVNANKLNHLVATNTSEDIKFTPEGKNPSGGQGKISIESSSSALLPVYDCSIFNEEDVRESPESDVRQDNIEGLLERMDLLEKFSGRGISTMQFTGISYGNIGDNFLWMARDRVRGVWFETEQFLEQNLVFSINLISVLKKFKASKILSWTEEDKLLMKAKATHFDVQVIAKLLDVDYPLQTTYERLQEIISQQHIKMTVKTKDMMDAIKIIKGFLDKDNRRIDLTIHREGVLRFETGQFHSGGMIDEKIDVELDRDEEDIEFAINYNDIELFLKSLKSTKKFTLNIPLSDEKRIITSVGNPFKHDKKITWSFFMTTFSGGIKTARAK